MGAYGASMRKGNAQLRLWLDLELRQRFHSMCALRGMSMTERVVQLIRQDVKAAQQHAEREGVS